MNIHSIHTLLYFYYLFTIEHNLEKYNLILYTIIFTQKYAILTSWKFCQTTELEWNNKTTCSRNSPLLSLSTLSNLPSTLLRKECKSNGDERPWSTLRLFPLKQCKHINSYYRLKQAKLQEYFYNIIFQCRNNIIIYFILFEKKNSTFCMGYVRYLQKQ